jgi:hypothetical protein
MALASTLSVIAMIAGLLLMGASKAQKWKPVDGLLILGGLVILYGNFEAWSQISLASWPTVCAGVLMFACAARIRSKST